MRTEKGRGGRSVGKSKKRGLANRTTIAPNPAAGLFSRAIVCGRWRIVVDKIAAWMPTYGDHGGQPTLEGCHIRYDGGSTPIELNAVEAAMFLAEINDDRHTLTMTPALPPEIAEQEVEIRVPA